MVAFEFFCDMLRAIFLTVGYHSVVIIILFGEIFMNVVFNWQGSTFRCIGTVRLHISVGIIAGDSFSGAISLTEAFPS